MNHPATTRSAMRWIVPAVGVWLVFAVWCVTADADSSTTTAIVDITETLVPLIAGLLCLSAARRSASGPWAWGLVGAGVFAWGLGQAVWTHYEVYQGTEVPFPSLADAGFLFFPLLATGGIALYHASARPVRSSFAPILEGALLAASVFTISWFTLLQGMVERADADSFAFWLSIAYPVGDVVLVAMVLHALSQLRAPPLSLWLLCVGLVLMAAADSAFVWLVESGTYVTGGWVDLAWITAFAVIGVAGLRAQFEGDQGESRADVSRLGLLLPYLPFTLGMFVIAARVWTGDVGQSEVITAGMLITLVMLRQYVALADGQALLGLLRVREAELHHLAMHDPLTGLANRALLGDRMKHSAIRRDDLPVGPTVLLVDLDDFKEVNDIHGHAAGDALLVIVAERLRQVVRAHDTVSRLGGDEFAILLEPSADRADEVAERLLSALSSPVTVEGVVLRISASVGIGEVEPGVGDEATRVGRAMREADMAMYAAKAAGKHRWRRYGPDVAGFGRPEAQDANTPAPAPV